MDYEEKYKQALERAKVLCDVADTFTIYDINAIFPELKESEDEWIRKGLINGFKECLEDCQYPKNAVKYWHNVKVDSILAWLEKQGEKKADKVEPKFKVGDWVVTNYGKVSRVVSVDKYGDGYTLDDGVYFSGSWCDMYRRWTIHDAKDGDVLVFKNNLCGIIICKSPTYYYDTRSYCRLVSDRLINKEESGWDSTLLVPATKEQRDLLFEKMKDAGYEWDAEKKELKKTEVASKESEDKRIWKEILNVFKQLDEGTTICGRNYDYAKWIAWLEKQDKKVDADKVIAWLVANICDYEYYVKWFKKEFGL